jgi:hypothetical protein
MANEPTIEPPEDFRFATGNTPAFDPVYLAIGHLSAIWAEFEFNINAAIWELANVERRAGTCMTSQLIGPGPRFRCLIALLNLRNAPQDLIASFNSLSQEAVSLGRQRNRYLHDPIVLNVEEDKIYRIETTADRKLKHEFVPLDLSSIEKLHGKIDRAADQFDDLFNRVLAETAPWPRTQYEQSKGILRHRHPPKPDNAASTPEPPQRPSEG